MQHWWAWILFGLAVLAVPVALMFRSQAEAPPVLGVAPPFELVDQTSTPLGHQDLLGQVVVVDFVFTRCPDVCPLLSTNLAKVRDALADTRFTRRGFSLISITVDPVYDTPEVLRAYADGYGAVSPQWRFLTGDQAAVDAAIGGYQQALERLPGAGEVPNIIHSERFVLVDPTGMIRGFHTSDEAGRAQLVAEAQALLQAP